MQILLQAKYKLKYVVKLYWLQLTAFALLKIQKRKTQRN